MNSPWAMLITPATPKMIASPEAAMTRIATTPKPLRNWVMMDSNMETSKTDSARAAQARQIAQPVSVRQSSPQPVDRRPACPAAVRAPILARHGPPRRRPERPSTTANRFLVTNDSPPTLRSVNAFTVLNVNRRRPVLRIRLQSRPYLWISEVTDLIWIEQLDPRFWLNPVGRLPNDVKLALRVGL